MLGSLSKIEFSWKSGKGFGQPLLWLKDASVHEYSVEVASLFPEWPSISI